MISQRISVFVGCHLPTGCLHHAAPHPHLASQYKQKGRKRPPSSSVGPCSGLSGTSPRRNSQSCLGLVQCRENRRSAIRHWRRSIRYTSKLSPKALRENTSPIFPTIETERTLYPSVVTFLNGCVYACQGAPDGFKSVATRDPGSRFYDRTKLVVYDAAAGDRVEGVTLVKPDLVGGLDLAPDERVLHPKGSFTKQVLLPVVVEVN